MKKLIQALCIGAVVAFIGSTVAVAADMPEAVVGTWSLNVAKSKFNPGPAPKSQTRMYSQSADGVSLSIEGVGADGSPMSQKSTFKYDGKDYPFTGSGLYDSLSLTRVDASTVKSMQKKAGKVVGMTTRTVSADGKMLTVATKGTDAKGGKYDDVAVYDKK